MAKIRPTSALYEKTPDGGRNDDFDFSDPYGDTAGYQAPVIPAPPPVPDFNYTNNPSYFRTSENDAPVYDPFSWGDYGQNANSAVLKKGFNTDGSKMTPEQLATQSLTDSRNMDTAIKEQVLLDSQSFDWMGTANVGLQGLNTAMEVGMYGDKKDYMKNVNKGLEQNMRNAQATHDNRATQQQNLGNTFSRNA